jgi:exodeoxyribonuclease III
MNERGRSTAMKLATWNVNSVRARIDLLKEWLIRNEPEILCLQETKVQDEDFPRDLFTSLGYESVIYGQKSYNGVSIHVMGSAMEDMRYGLPEPWVNDQKRVVSIRCEGIRIINVYVPHGESTESPKFPYKLQFLHHLHDYLKTCINEEKHVAVLGDFNVAPDDRDVYNPDLYRGQVMFHPNEHAALEKIKSLGFEDAFRLHNEEGGMYSFWDYKGGAFWKNEGWRIDHIWLSEKLAPRCSAVEIDKSPRKSRKMKPSDHTPVIAVIDPIS